MWPDKETEIDYLNFGYMVNMVADIATNRKLGSVPLSVSEASSLKPVDLR